MVKKMGQGFAAKQRACSCVLVEATAEQQNLRLTSFLSPQINTPFFNP